MKTTKILCGIIALLILLSFNYVEAQREEAPLSGAGTDVTEVDISRGFVGVGARALGMGGNHISLVSDYSAVYWNPAQLSYIRRIEVSGGFSHLNVSNTTNYKGTTYNNNDSYADLNSLGLVVPLPTKRGGLAFALGINRIKSFDRIFAFGDTSKNMMAREINSGGLYAISLGSGIQVSPISAFGINLEIWTGTNNYSWTAENYMSSQSEDTTDDSIEEIYYEDNYDKSYTGIGANFGFSVHPHKMFSLATKIELPVSYGINSEGMYRTDSVFADTFIERQTEFETEYNYSLPFKFKFGASFKLPYFVLTGDIAYTDWRQLEFNSPTWFTRQNKYINDNYRKVLKWGLGAEGTIPYINVKLRGGYSQAPIPYTHDKIINDKSMITGGVGYLIDNVFSVDAAVVLSNYKRSDQAREDLTEEYELTRVVLNLGYRGFDF